MMKQSFAPWTEEEVLNINKFQNFGMMHNFTCGSPDEVKECSRRSKMEGDDLIPGETDGTLIASKEGLVCPCGGYTQKWVYKFMTKPLIEGYFLKYLPVYGEITDPDHVIFKIGFRWTDAVSFDSFLGPDIREALQGKLFLCTRDLKLGDKTFSMLGGHMNDVYMNPFYPRVSWSYGDFLRKDEHIIQDLHHSDYLPYRIRTQHGYGSPGRYVRVLGEVDNKEFNEGQFFPEEFAKALFKDLI
jgi:hypothetical protein